MNQCSSGAEHLIVGVRRDDRNVLSPGEAHLERLERLVEAHRRDHARARLEIRERCPVANKELVGLPAVIVR
jgi:hypothetical protein